MASNRQGSVDAPIESKEKPGFDAGPLFTIIPAGVDEKTFSTVQIDECSMSLIKIAASLFVTTRFAIVGFINLAATPPILHLVYRPSLPARATEAEMQAMEENFGVGNFVKSKDDGLPGLVHEETWDQAERYARRTPDSPLRFLIDNPKKVLPIGLSCSIISSPRWTRTCNVEWIGRSTMQFKVFLCNELAQQVFLLDGFSAHSSRSYTTTFHLRRTIPGHIMHLLIRAAHEEMNKGGSPVKLNYTNAVMDHQCAIAWERIRYDKAEIVSRLERTIDQLVCLERNPAGPFWPQDSDYQLANKVYLLAEKRGLRLHAPSSSSLSVAIAKYDINLVTLLIEHGACIHRDSITTLEGIKAEQAKMLAAHGSLAALQQKILAAVAPQKKQWEDLVRDIRCIDQINAYIQGCIQLGQYINKPDNEALRRELNHYSKIIDLSKPVNDFNTPILLAMRAMNRGALELLIEHKVNIDEVVGVHPITALSKAIIGCHAEARVLFLIRRGASLPLAMQLLINDENFQHAKKRTEKLLAWIESKPTLGDMQGLENFLFTACLESHQIIDVLKQDESIFNFVRSYPYDPALIIYNSKALILFNIIKLASKGSSMEKLISFWRSELYSENAISDWLKSKPSADEVILIQDLLALEAKDVESKALPGLIKRIDENEKLRDFIQKSPVPFKAFVNVRDNENIDILVYLLRQVDDRSFLPSEISVAHDMNYATVGVLLLELWRSQQVIDQDLRDIISGLNRMLCFALKVKEKNNFYSYTSEIAELSKKLIGASYLKGWLTESDHVKRFMLADLCKTIYSEMNVLMMNENSKVANKSAFFQGPVYSPRLAELIKPLAVKYGFVLESKKAEAKKSRGR
jgi:hypothetical protein